MIYITMFIYVIHLQTSKTWLIPYITISLPNAPGMIKHGRILRLFALTIRNIQVFQRSFGIWELQMLMPCTLNYLVSTGKYFCLQMMNQTILYWYIIQYSSNSYNVVRQTSDWTEVNDNYRITRWKDYLLQMIDIWNKSVCIYIYILESLSPT